jgi:predicted  nucleic acid-binding Zn-ribbon protein
MTKTKTPVSTFADTWKELHDVSMEIGQCQICGTATATTRKFTKAETRKEIKDRDARIGALEAKLDDLNKQLAENLTDMKDLDDLLDEEKAEHKRLKRAYDKESKLTGELTKKLTELEEVLPKILVRVAKAKVPLPESSLKELVDMDRVGKELAKS